MPHALAYLSALIVFGLFGRYIERRGTLDLVTGIILVLVMIGYTFLFKSLTTS